MAHDLDGVLDFRGDPPCAASLTEGVRVETGPLRVIAPWLPEPVPVVDGESLFDHATAETYDLAAILADLAIEPGPVALAQYVCD